MEIGGRSEVSLAVRNPIQKRLWLVIAILFLYYIGSHIRRKAGGVGKKVYHSDIHLLACLRIYIRLKALYIHLYRVCKSVVSPLQQLHHSNGCTHRFAAGGHIKDGIGCHLYGIGIYLLVAIGLKVCQLIAAYYGKHSTRYGFLCYCFIYYLIRPQEICT